VKYNSLFFELCCTVMFKICCVQAPILVFYFAYGKYPLRLRPWPQSSEAGRKMAGKNRPKTQNKKACRCDYPAGRTVQVVFISPTANTPYVFALSRKALRPGAKWQVKIGRRRVKKACRCGYSAGRTVQVVFISPTANTPYVFALSRKALRPGAKWQVKIGRRRIKKACRCGYPAGRTVQSNCELSDFLPIHHDGADSSLIIKCSTHEVCAISKIAEVHFLIYIGSIAKVTRDYDLT
jgi:hypothetical protein